MTNNPQLYTPERSDERDKILERFRGIEPTAWAGLEAIFPALLRDFGVNTGSALEFGCEYGYSTAVLAHHFDNVIAVDTFEGDVHSGIKNNHLSQTAWNLANFKNVELVVSDYRDFESDVKFDFAHVDIIHNFYDTFQCGKKALQCAPVVVFHDTESFPEVRRAVAALASEFNCEFHNYPLCYGLGILKKNEP